MRHTRATRGGCDAIGTSNRRGSVRRSAWTDVMARGKDAGRRRTAQRKVDVAEASARKKGKSVAKAAAQETNQVDVTSDLYCGKDGQVLVRPSHETGPGTMGQKKYYIHTWGCQMNKADAERMAGDLETKGYVNCIDPDQADVLVYNTCSIRDKAEQKVYSALGIQAERKRKQPDLKIVVAGCVASQEGETLLRRVPELDLVMGPHHANRIGSLLEQVELGQQVCAIEPIHIEEDIAVPRRDSNTTAWVNVIYGCNERCSYCVVPNVRGVEQSREPDAIRRECHAVGEAGYKEITLLGQNIDAYGRDLDAVLPKKEDGTPQRWRFTDLLYHVHDAPGIERIRFATSHPRYFADRLIRACHELPKVCEYFHIPFQSGNNDVLKAMKRGYSRERYLDIIKNIRKYMPDASLSADVIVGFPGETEEQFMDTVTLIQEVGFDLVNTAAYSPRPMTPAAEWENQVADLVKQDRLHRINRVVKQVAEERSQRYLGRVEEILVEGVNPKNPSQLMGRTRGNKLTFFEGPMEYQGKLVDVLIEDARAFSLTGRMAQS